MEEKQMSFRLTRISLVATSLAVAAATTGLVSLASPTVANAAVPAPPAGFTTTWSDDFSGASGTGADANFSYDTGAGSTFGTGEIETMTNSTANVYQDGAGHLVLKALHTGTDPNSGWTSGRLETPATFGAAAGGVVRMESVIQQPNLTTANGAGYWPAFWMLGSTLRSGVAWPGSGEVDILEDINSRSSVFGTLHCGVNPGGPCNESSGIGSGEHACAGCQTGQHDYAVEIDRSVSPEQIRWYLDGVNYFTVNASQVDAATWTNAVDHSFFIIYDLAMGGGFPAAFGGGPNAATVSGGAMVIDSVAVYNKGPVSGTYATSTATGAITSGIAGKCMEDSGGNTANATPVTIDTCGAAGQTWSTYSDSTLRTGGKCLDAASAGTVNGTKLQVYDCNGSPAQTWQASGGGYKNPQSGRCIDDPSGTTTNGTQLQLFDCTGTAEQQWSAPGGGTTTPPPPTNIAQGKTTTASSVENAGTPASAATDGNTGTRWSSAFSDPQWLQVDLGQSYNITQVTLTWETAYAKAFQLQTSTDGTSWTSIYSTTTGTGGTQTVSVTGSGRYLRVYGIVRATAYGYSLWELGVAGTPGGGTTTSLLSQGHPATASSTENAGTPASAAVDGNTGTRWSSAFSDPQWLQVDLGATHTISQVVLNWETAAGKAFQIQTSTDGTSWTSIYSTTTGTGGIQTLNVSGSGRYVRMYGTARTTAYGYSLWEFQVLGS
jgi:F5/8 type C domain/Ricin-type beta-trefoil lectin domain/Glycosyl hydrolases family 16